METMEKVMKRKIELMVELFGVHIPLTCCKECNHLLVFEYHDRTYRKCDVYGLSHSRATDWAGRWLACGMFNKEYDGKPVYKVRFTERPEEVQIEGQIGLFSDEEVE